MGGGARSIPAFEIRFECVNPSAMKWGEGLISGMILSIAKIDSFGKRKVPSNGWKQI